MKNQKIDKPLITTLDEIETEIRSILRKSGVPAFLLLPIMNNICNQLEIEKSQELTNAKVNYEKALAENKKNEENSNDKKEVMKNENNK